MWEIKKAILKTSLEEAYPFTLSYDETCAYSACTSSSVSLFLDTIEFSAATAVFTNIELTTKAPDGFYVYGTLNREQSSGLLQTGVNCSTLSPCTPTPTPLNCSFVVRAEDITPPVFENVIINVRRRNPSYPPESTGYDYPSNNSVKLYTSNDNINWVEELSGALSISFESVLLTIEPGTPLYIGIKHRLPSPPYQPNTYVNSSFGECITGGSYTEPTLIGYGNCGTLPDASFYYGLVPNTDIDLYFEVNINSDTYIECYN